MNIELLEQDSPWHEKVHFFKTIDSTNTVALKLGEGGAAEGTLVLAEEQTAGRGQFQRPWSSPAGMGLWTSLLLRPRITPEMIPALSRFAVLALYDTILKMEIKVGDMTIKEPNDLLIGEKKVAGVLVETRLGHNSSFAVIGIGLNLLQQESDFPLALKEKITSLSLASEKQNIDCQKILITLLQQLYTYYQQLLYEPSKLEAAWKLRVCF